MDYSDFKRLVRMGNHVKFKKYAWWEFVGPAVDAYRGAWNQATLQNLSSIIEKCKSEPSKLETSLMVMNDTKTYAGLKKEQRSAIKSDVFLDYFERFAKEESKRMKLDDAAQVRKTLETVCGKLITAYQQYIPDSYMAALKATFINTDADARCFRCFHDEVEWGTRLKGALDDSTKASDVNGYTPTVVAGKDATNMGDLSQPPRNRRIEFPVTTNEHTLFHEMLHWVCHEDFRTGMDKDFKDPDREIGRECVTEYFTRAGLNEWETGGYGNYMPHAIAVVNDHGFDKVALANAYFRGVNVQKVIATMVERYNKRKEDRNAAAQATYTPPSNDFVRGRVQTVKGRFVDPSKVSDDFKSQVTAAYPSGTFNYDAAKGELNAAWANYLKDLYSKP